MSIYVIKLSCGHEEKFDLYGDKNTREMRIKYLKKYGMCKECWKKQRKEKGLIFNVDVYPKVDRDTGKFVAYLWFSGDTTPYKDAIKSLDYRWKDMILCNTLPPKKCWRKLVRLEQVSEEAERAKQIGASFGVGDGKIEIPEDIMNASVGYMNAYDDQKIWQLNIEAAKHGESHYPTPDEAKKILQNRSWNGCVYGSLGDYSVYLNDEKIDLPDEQALTLKSYAERPKVY